MRNITVVLGCLLVVLACKSDDDFVAPVANQPQNPQTVSLQYAKNFGGSKNELASAVVKLQDGGYAVFGETQSIDIDITDKSDTSYDYWLLRFNAADELLWSKTYGGSLDEKGADLIATQDGGFVLTGYASSSDGDVSQNFGNQDFWITKLDSSGNITWEKSFGFNGSDRAYAIIQTQDSGYLISGVLDVTASAGQGNTLQANNQLHAGGDYWAVKLDATGNQEWTKYFGGNLSDDPFGVAETSSGNFILVGASDSADVDISNNKGSYDYWVVSISDTGALLWEKNFGGTQIDEAHGIIKTSDNNFIIVGNTRSDDTDVSVNYGDSDLWLIKIDENGNLIWEKTIGGASFDTASSITKSANGYLISGSSRSENAFISTNNGQNDALVVQIDETGAVLWLKTIGGSEFDFAYDVTQLNDGSIIAVGETTSNNFDLSNNNGFTDALIIKIN
ncbi:hypothetical protein [Aurantibacter aestuarii]|uniref:Bulb-type lectin domain-containing protein n=1 Tax=Aurantibacter aestuarii TaxID=1266046 RepID=A0A2T1NCH0_9FLAO|nr:hypothetical protein [Aurantibacter aestuarii]PSG90142.1 hypothetical protein C7H52_02375 [Aurantibacter aestuarii]